MAESPSASLPPKLYFRIGEVAELVGVEPHVLRYWEREFRTIRPTKSAKGQRVYSRRDVENLVRVRELLYKEGFTIAGAKKRLHDPATHSGGEPAAAAPAENAAAAPRPGAGLTALTEEGVVKAREELFALRREIEDLLAEIDPPKRPAP
jgi:DNA-binding transcriptional MerR regulator